MAAVVERAAAAVVAAAAAGASMRSGMAREPLDPEAETATAQSPAWLPLSSGAVWRADRSIADHPAPEASSADAHPLAHSSLDSWADHRRLHCMGGPLRGSCFRHYPLFCRRRPLPPPPKSKCVQHLHRRCWWSELLLRRGRPAKHERLRTSRSGPPCGPQPRPFGRPLHRPRSCCYRLQRAAPALRCARRRCTLRCPTAGYPY